jgi:hypothetical protein
MKGLEISRLFSSEWLLPFIDRELPDLLSHIAVGRFMGSDVIGADDHLSQDHNWGPTVEVYLDDEYDIRDNELAARINSAAPIEFLGIRRRGGHDTAITLRHGSLFHDGSGQLTSLRDRYHSYPDDIHRLRLATCFYDIAHYGEYNFVWRLVERNDVIAMQIALGHFSTAVMRLHFYLDRDFAPYWKWLPHEFRRRGYSPDINEQLLALPRLTPMEQLSAIQWICGQLRARLRSDGVVPGDMANPYNVPWFFRFREEILRAIIDPEIRNLAW